MRNIHIHNNWDALPSCLIQHGITAKSAVIITDTNVADLYLSPVSAVLSPYFALTHHIFPAGEFSKNFATLQDILVAAHKSALDRSSVIFALGGGVVSDLAGFAASIYMRGIQWVCLPTTLLAQVDSAVGGKTGIDFAGAKNLLGSFHQPAIIYANVSALQTLPQKEFISGLAEVIKYGIIFDDKFLDNIIDCREAIARRDFAVLDGIICRCCEIKSFITTQDERDVGLRQILNYGHTFGHAIESLLDFTLPHGHCVALGMMCAAMFPYNAGGLTQADVDKIRDLHEFFGLPTTLPKHHNLTPRLICDMMRRDKKASGGDITLIVSHKIGSAEILNNADEHAVIAAIKTIFTDNSQ